MQDVLKILAWVVLGSAVGGPARYFVSGVVAGSFGHSFPWGTIVVNVSGALAIGVLAAAASTHGVLATPAAWQFAATGFLGSYTTVSSFSLQTLALVRDGRILHAGGNVLLSVVLSLSAVALGYAAGLAALGGNIP